MILLVVAISRFVVEYYMPKFLLVARAHSISITTIFLRVMTRKAGGFKREFVRILQLDAVRLTPKTAAAVLQFRSTNGRSAESPLESAKKVPSEVQPAVVGNVAELQIDGVFPRTTVFVQIDPDAFAIRWTSKHFISLHAVESVNFFNKAKRRKGTFVKRFSLKCTPAQISTATVGSARFTSSRATMGINRRPTLNCDVSFSAMIPSFSPDERASA
eukprot:6758228-Prymnesium_polylepis.1